MNTWFQRFRGVNGLVVSMVSRCQWFRVSIVSWFHRLRGVNGFMVS